MVGSMRGESASSGLDGSGFTAAYQNGQHGAYSVPHLEKSGSFREKSEPHIIVSGPRTSRNILSPMDSPVCHFLPLEPVSMSMQKYSRQGELRRALGITVEEHTFGSLQTKSLSLEEVKRIKTNLSESMAMARDRAKTFQESILKIEKYRNMRKRQKDDQISEKSGISKFSKMRGLSHQNSGKGVSQRIEDREKNVLPNKHNGSSMMQVQSEGRGNIPPRQCSVPEKEKNGLLEKDKSVLRGCNGGSTLNDDKIQGPPADGDGWEKQLKRKRSVGTMINRVTDGDRKTKSPIQQRPNNEVRTRTSDANGFRSGVPLGSSKMDGSCTNSTNPRVIPRNDMESSSLSNERREHSAGTDKEHIVTKGVNKLITRENAQPVNQTSLTKGKASRAPRTGFGVPMITSSNLAHSAEGLGGKERDSPLSKNQSLSEATNRKRPMSAGSSSPPQWKGQRPQKFSRTRRANVVSPVSSLDEFQFLDGCSGTPDVSAKLTPVDASGFLVSRGIINNAHQSKLKLENVPSPAGLSENDESSVVENKYKEKGISNIELEDAIPNATHETSTFVFPTKKIKVPLKEDIGDGVRRQGRTGRGSIQAKVCTPLSKEKTESMNITKPLKNGKLGSDKNESRIGRPPLKKMSDRKAHVRTANPISSGSTDLAGESDNDNEALLEAATAARKANYSACSSPFWKKMEPVFSFVTSEDTSYIMNQINFAVELDGSLSNVLHADHDVMDEVISEMVSSPRSSLSKEQVRASAFGSNGCSGAVCSSSKVPVGTLGTESLSLKMVPLSQILLSALISEDEIEKLDYDANGQLFNDNFPCDANTHIENGHLKNFTESKFEVGFGYNNSSGDNIHSNGFTTSSDARPSNIRGLISINESLMENIVEMQPDTSPLSSVNQLRNMDSDSPYQCQYDHMSLSDRILMELHSVGLFPQIVPELVEGCSEEIGKEISKLKIMLYHQVKQKKPQLDKLGKTNFQAKEIEERNLEQLAIDKLVEMAHKKLMGGRSSSSHKSGVSRVSKQMSLGFAKRTISRCQKFEETGRSCFNEPTLWDVLTAPVHNNNAKSTNGKPNMTERHGLDGTVNNGPTDSQQDGSQISNRGKKKEVPLDEVVTTATSKPKSTLNTTLSSAKWKQTDGERDKEGSLRSSTAKTGRPSLSNGRGERKIKTKPKQKSLGRITETQNIMSPTLIESSESNAIHQEVELQRPSGTEVHDSTKQMDDSAFPNLLHHGIVSFDGLDVAEELGGQGQDLAAWLNAEVDDETLQDVDFMDGLHIPMDDISELALNF